jgi:hypothetical protein
LGTYVSASDGVPPERRVPPADGADALYAPFRWPAGILTTPDLDQDGGGTRPVEFEADVAELERLLIEVTTDRRDRFSQYFHPLFGRMSESAWLRWAYLHADHHLRQFGV